MKSNVTICFVVVTTFFMKAFATQPDSQSPHGKLKWDCQVCHTSVSWKKLKDPTIFKHEETGFPLMGMHKIVDCRSCHQSLKFKQVRTSCSDCHTDIHQGQFGIDCQSCHTPDNWQNQQELFTLHTERGFPLVGVHAIADCEACHINQQINEFAGTPVDCNGCHVNDFMLSTNPNHLKADFSMECQTCHQPMNTSWKETTFKHATIELQGAHAQLDCNSCHMNSYAGTTQECFGCHATDYNQTKSPSHNSYGFPTDCNICHNQSQWEGAQFDHVQFSGFELRGAHAFIECKACHVNNQFSGLPQDCFGCHENDYSNVPDPNHVSNSFPTDCMTCHNETSWQQVTFDHNQTQFPLTGAHAAVQCMDCHSGGYDGTSTDCYSCHQQDYNSVSDPNHAANNFNHDCTQCHNTSGWDPSTFNHNQTQFPLTGAHISLQCIDCHSQGYTETPTDCYSCHQQDYNSTTDPNHAANNFSHDCTQCHNTSGWEPSIFNHDQTSFPLTGVHLTLQCIDCHSQGYTGTPIDCYSCHHQDFNSTTDPNHATNNFSHDCTQCHNTTGWEPSTFNHDQTSFPLTGVHLTLQCIDCHSSGYTNTPTDCYSCHQQDFNSTTDPNHAANNFGHDCTQCHSTAGWSPAAFDHNQTNFPLTGAHLTLQCIDCHSNGYAGTPTDCYSCHEQDFINVSDPNHVASNFNHDCTQCHNTSAWSPATFDHNQTNFPLLGSHIMLPCISCHANGYTGTPTDCYSCHQQDYDNTNDPNHVAVGFPTNCENCHNSIAWSQTTWDHDSQYFPIYSGRHQGVWNSCSDCHLNQSNYAEYSCNTVCHSNAHHQNEDCYSCHPDGRGGD